MLLLTSATCLSAQPLSRSFELRYITDNPEANGQSGFKGGRHSIFSTDQRVEYLNNYAEYAKLFFNDPSMNKKVVSLDQARERLNDIKPQPLPKVRKRIVLEGIKAYGYKPGNTEAAQRRVDFYNDLQGVSIKKGILTIQPEKSLGLDFKKQAWRMRFDLKVMNEADSAFQLHIGDAAVVSSNEFKAPPGWIGIQVELDVVNQRYNVYVNDQLIKDFVPFERTANEISSLKISAGSMLRLDAIRGVGYTKSYTDGVKDLHSRDVPFSIETILDDNFELADDIEGWTRADFDDSRWQVVNLPYAHGGERHRNETLYLRKKVTIPSSKRVEFNLESLDPSGEIWINDNPVHVAHNRHPISLDVTRYIRFGEENLIAIKVDPYQVQETMRHTSSDEYIGWFAGRAHLDCTQDTYVKDVFVTTQSVSDPARLQAQVWLAKKEMHDARSREIKKLQASDARLQLKLYKWFPQESADPVAQTQRPVKFRNGKEDHIIASLEVDNPELWTPDRCNLYKLVVEVLNKEGDVIDDAVVTTGIRTVSQEGGTFRINGKPEMMNGALLFSVPAPMDKIAQWQRCPPSAYIVKDLMQLKAMNANTARMSQHHGPAISINDPRYAEYADQIGIMFQWATTSWVRTASPWQLDFEGLPKYVRQVRNHPSIVMWQPSNHPNFIDFSEAMEWSQKVYDTIWQQDKSRLVCPSANMSRMGELRSDDGKLSKKGLASETPPVWTAPGITRGSMEYIVGYGFDWSKIEQWPGAESSVSEQNWSMGALRIDYLNSNHRAFFDFESEESIGQPNWSLRKGKPEYQVMSYEWKYDPGSIGEHLSVDQWLAGQAYQAFSGFEAYKKKRWLDYDGMTWCCLRGGANTATYQKPLIDYYDHAKLGFYAVKMAFQPVLACSKNVDLAYGPSDSVPVVVMNLGDQKKVNLKIDVKTLSNQIVFSKTFPNITLQEGRSFQDLKLDIENGIKPGYYIFEYTVRRNVD